MSTPPVVHGSAAPRGRPAPGALLELIRRMPEGEGAGPGASETIEPTQGRPGAGGHGPTGPGGPGMRLFGGEYAERPPSPAGIADALMIPAATLSAALTVLEWGAVGVARAGERLLDAGAHRR